MSDPVALTISFLGKSYFVISMLIGLVINFIWRKYQIVHVEILGPALAWGIICGERAWGIICGERLWDLPAALLKGLKPPIFLHG